MNKRIGGLGLGVLLVNSGYLAAFAEPSIFYMGNVLLHLGLGLGLMVLAALWARRYPWESGAFLLSGLPALYLVVGDLGKETTDLSVRVFSGLNPAEELQNQLVAIEDGRVRLLGRAGAGWERAAAPGGGEGGGRVAGEPRRRRQVRGSRVEVRAWPREGWIGGAKAGTSFDQGEQGLADVFAGAAVVEDLGAAV